MLFATPMMRMSPLLDMGMLALRSTLHIPQPMPVSDGHAISPSFPDDWRQP
jgi:hypothetical protein